MSLYDVTVVFYIYTTGNINNHVQTTLHFGRKAATAAEAISCVVALLGATCNTIAPNGLDWIYVTSASAIKVTAEDNDVS